MYVAEPSKPPENTSVEVLDSTRVKVQWKSVPEESRRGIITKYVIFYTVEKETKEMEVRAPQQKQVVYGLNQSTTYSFQVWAETVKGAGPKSKPENVTTGGKESK